MQTYFGFVTQFPIFCLMIEELHPKIKDLYFEILFYQSHLKSLGIKKEIQLNDIVHLNLANSLDTCLFIGFIIHSSYSNMNVFSEGINSTIHAWLRDPNLIFQRFIHQIIKERSAFKVQPHNQEYFMGISKPEESSFGKKFDFRLIPDTIIYSEDQIVGILDSKFSWISQNQNKESIRPWNKYWFRRVDLHQISYYLNYFEIELGFLCFPFAANYIRKFTLYQSNNNLWNCLSYEMGFIERFF